MRRAESRARRAGALAPLGLVAFLAVLACHCDLTVSLNNLGGGCPPSLHGPAQVKVPAGSGDGGSGGAHAYCIDTTEVTNSQYKEFLASGYTVARAGIPGETDAGASCGSVATTTPDDGWPYPPGNDAFPVSNVNWCQAYAYCKWAGKRLCGQIGGGPLSTQYDVSPAQSQWFNACSAGGTRAYPYSNTFNPSACGLGGNGATVQSVGTRSQCIGGFAGLEDMCGNVWEWTDTCTSAAQNAFCYAMGGGFDSTQQDLACAGQRNWTRTSGATNIGIRCCMDL